MSKVRKVYNLRKTANLRNVGGQQSRIVEGREGREQEARQQNKQQSTFERNTSVVSQGVNFGNNSQVRDRESEESVQVDGEEVVIDKLQVDFEARLGDIARREVRLRNIGNSAVYLRWKFISGGRINPNGVKDIKPKFYSHYQACVVRPKEEVTFIFAFVSEFPGIFTEEVELECQPPLRTAIPPLKLTGKAVIDDQWQKKRQQFSSAISEAVLVQEVRQILSDLVAQVKLPSPPLPDVNNPKIAEIQFEQQNKHLNLFYNDYLHQWFNELFHQICDKAHLSQEERYWNQSVDQLQHLINSADYLDDVDKKCYISRLEHYCYLSRSPLPHKSELYSTVYQFVSQTAYRLGGDFVDAGRKQLDMWQVPFKEPLEHQSPEQLKARKEQIDKIKAEWLKRTKKKKWGEEQEKEVVGEFKKKVQAKTTQDLLERFTNFEEDAQFIKTRQFLKKSDFSLMNYKSYLERMKTVKQYPLEGRKVLIKFHLKLKQNCQQKLKELQQYLTKKKQQEKRLEQQKKNNQNNPKKKKVAPKTKKKGQKEEEQQKPLFFDFMSILDQENWNGFLQTFRVVSQKQPFLVLIGVTYGPRSGRVIPQYSVKFLLQHLKTVQSSIEFFPHQSLATLQEKIEDQSIAEGSILLLQNLNFLPYEVTQQEIVTHNEPLAITKRKLLHPEIRDFFDQLNQSIDVVVNEDKFLESLSGFSAYLGREVVLGTLWWRYVGLSIRVNGGSIILGGDFGPKSYLLLERVTKVAKVYLSGVVGVKFYAVEQGLDELGGINIVKSEKEAVKQFLNHLERQGIRDRLVVPQDFVETHQIQENGERKGSKVVDIGDKSIQKINQISVGNLFLLGDTGVQIQQSGNSSESFKKIIKSFYKRQEAKRERHAKQSGTPSGINFSEDLVIYLVGVDESAVEKIEIKERRVAGQEGEQGTL